MGEAHDARRRRDLARPDKLAAEPYEVERIEPARPTRAFRRSPPWYSLRPRPALLPIRLRRAGGQAGLPRAVDPAELLDGAVTSGEYHWAALRNPTIVFQRNALVRALYREHGRRLRFAGLVLVRGYEQTADDKQRAATAAAETAVALGADGAVITTDAAATPTPTRC